MPAPKRKRTSEETFTRILHAIRAIAADSDAPRTKREIERRSGLAHDAVARAFRQGAQEEPPHRIVTEFKALTDELATSRVSLDRDKQLALQRQNAELKDQIRHLNTQLDAHAMALFAFHLRDTDAAGTHAEINTTSDVIPIRRRRDEEQR